MRSSSFSVHGRSSINKNLFGWRIFRTWSSIFPATSTIVDALLRSQGINDYGSLNITLKEKTEQKKVYDFYDLLLKGENPATESLLENDVFYPRLKNRILLKERSWTPCIFMSWTN